MTELAGKVGVSRQTIHRAIAANLMSRGIAQRVAEVLRVPEPYLLYGSGPSHIEGDVAAVESDFGPVDTQWEPTTAVREDSQSYNAEQLEEFLRNFDNIVRTLRNFPGGPLGMKLKIGYLNAVEDVARETGNKLPLEYYQLRKRVADGEL